jgi:hypothetical protein
VNVSAPADSPDAEMLLAMPGARLLDRRKIPSRHAARFFI